MAVKIITISREFGSGGRFIGEEVAKKLGMKYYDKDIIGQIAEQSGFSPDYIREHAELSPKKGLFAYAFAGRDSTGKSVEDLVYEAQRKVILDLAENLIKLSGYRPYEDIDIVETGLRPGEKLYEELLVQKENLASTKYEKIFVEQREHLPYKRMLADLERLHQVLETEDKQQIVQLMREIVPTFHTPEEVNAQRIREEEAKSAASASVSTPVKAEAVAVSG